jgi:AAA family ATP:ADP antiporter
VICFQLRSAYVNAFRQQLARKEVDLSEFERYVTDPETVKMLGQTLAGPQERQIVYSLKLLQNARGEDFSGALLPLLSHASPYVREEAVRTLQALPGSYADRAEPLLRDESEEVRKAVIEYLCASSSEGPESKMRSLLENEDMSIRLAAAKCASSRAAPVFKPSIEQVEALMRTNGHDGRLAAAHLAVHLPTVESIRILRELLADQNCGIVGAAAGSAGAAGHFDLVFEVIPMLARKQLKEAARKALQQYGGRIAGTLGDVLRDGTWDITVRREIPWVLARIGTRRSAEALVDNLGENDPLLKYRVVKALNRIHETNAELPAPNQAIADRILAETRAYYEALTLFQAVAPGNQSSTLLGRALKERMDQDLEIIFRLLGLQYPQKDIYFAYAALKGGHSDRRASAIEFLDNLLQKNLKSIILPLLEESSVERLIDRASRLLGIQSKRAEEALTLILQRQDAWLKACALHEVGEKRLKNFVETCRAMAKDEDPVVRETAEWALKRCA